MARTRGARLYIPTSAVPSRICYLNNKVGVSQGSSVPSVPEPSGPLRGDNATGHFFIEGRSSATGADQPFACIAAVSPDYLEALGVATLQGRMVAGSDRADAAPVAVVSAAFARRYWPGQDPVGRRIRFENNPTEPWITIVGVVGDVRQLGLHEPPPPVPYLPYQQFPLPFTTLAVRSTLPEDDGASY